MLHEVSSSVLKLPLQWLTEAAKQRAHLQQAILWDWRIVFSMDCCLPLELLVHALSSICHRILNTTQGKPIFHNSEFTHPS